MGKVKKEKQSADETQEIGEVSIKEEDTYEDKLKNCSVIAKPMAPKKLTKKCLKLIKKGNYQSKVKTTKTKSIEFLKMSTFNFESVFFCIFSIQAKDLFEKWIERRAEPLEER